MSVNRSRRRMDTNIVNLVGLDVNEVGLLNVAGVTDGVMLSVLGYDGITEVLTTSSVVTKKKLEKVGLYVAKGNAITPATTMEDIVLALNNPPTPSSTPTVTKGSTARTSVKVSVNFLKEFAGAPIDWEDWEEKTVATVRQTHFAPILEGPIDVNDTDMVRLNNQFYNVLYTAVRDSSAFHLVDRIKDQDGNKAWNDLKEWYGSAATSRTIIDHYQKKLDGLRLDESTRASEYVNQFIICCQKLEAKDEGPTKATKIKLFLDKITDEDYNVVKQNLQHKGDASFDDCVMAVRAREQILIQEGDKETFKRARRMQDNGGSSGKGKSGSIPFVPSWIFKTKDVEKVKSDLLQWRKKFNEGKKHLTADESEYTKKGHGKGDNGGKGDSSKSSNNNHGQKRGRSAKRKVRRTRTQVKGTPESAIKVSMKDGDDDGSESDDSDSDDESSVKGGNASSKKTRSKSASKSKKRAKKARRFAQTRRGRSDGKPRVIIDTGTDLEVIGGVGWKVLSQVDEKTAKLDGALAGMTGRPLKLVTAVTAYDHPDFGVVLLGVGNAAWDDREEQTESLLNPHELRKFNVTVNDMARVYGGEQMLKVQTIDIPLDFIDGKTMSFYHRMPTQAELNRYPVHWLTPENHISEKYKRHRRLYGEVVDDELPWKERLGNCPDDVVLRTLDATTQYCKSTVEMENRAHPRQHRKKRLLPLHPRRIPGRTDSDTFYASVKSVRQFTCVQIYHCVQSGYTHCVPMKLEQHAIESYVDFIREVGAPNTLLVDNAKALTKTKFTNLSRQYAVKQQSTTPYNPQQNTSERKLAVVKHRTMLTLRLSNAPLSFWCYCMQHMVDCLNHTALRKLGWRTPIERIFGNTPDISMFRFVFWESVLYFEPIAKFPKPTFLPGRFLGIAWNHGDAFTYRIWTEPDGDWTKGGS